MTTKALLVLEDGSVFAGRAFGASARGEGEVVLFDEIDRGLKPAAWVTWHDPLKGWGIDNESDAPAFRRGSRIYAPATNQLPARGCVR